MYWVELLRQNELWCLYVYVFGMYARVCRHMLSARCLNTRVTLRSSCRSFLSSGLISLSVRRGVTPSFIRACSKSTLSLPHSLLSLVYWVFVAVWKGNFSISAPAFSVRDHCYPQQVADWSLLSQVMLSKHSTALLSRNSSAIVFMATVCAICLWTFGMQLFFGTSWTVSWSTITLIVRDAAAAAAQYARHSTVVCLFIGTRFLCVVEISNF